MEWIELIKTLGWKMGLKQQDRFKLHQRIMRAIRPCCVTAKVLARLLAAQAFCDARELDEYSEKSGIVVC
jgi:hypothetical protein